MKQFYFLKTFIILILAAIPGHAQCTPPALTSAPDPAVVCAGSQVTLTAASNSGTIAWFGSATGAVPLGTGTTFQTPPLSATTSYWVEAQAGTILGTPTSGGGKTTHGTSGSAVVPASKPWGLMFDATQPFILNSVEVYLSSATPGNIVMQLKDSNFNIIATTTVAAPAGGTGANPVAFTVPLNFTIPVGTGYRLVADSAPAMIRDLSGNSFPYPIGTVGSITQGTINDSNTGNPGVYYLFYNWNYTPYVPCASPREEVVATVTTTALPATNAQTFCGSATVGQLQATGTDLKWYSSLNGGTQLTAATALATGTYYVSQTLGGCESARKSVAVTVTPTPLAPLANAQSFCNGATVAQLTATGTNLVWYADETGGTPLAGATVLANGTYYVSQSVGSCESARTSVSVTVNTPPEAPDAEAQTFCGPATVAQLTAEGSNLKWYLFASGGTALLNTAALTSGIYYVSQSNGTCESTRTPFTVTINTIPAAPETQNYAFCGTATIAQLTATGTNLNWYADVSGGSPLTSTTALTNGTYYVSQTVGNCESPRASSVITIIPLPAAPVANAQNFCESGTVSQLVAAGTGLSWYTDENGGEPLEGTASLATGTYYVSQTINDCESPRLAVEITITITPQPEGESNQDFNEGDTLADLDITGQNLTWYAADGTTQIPSTTVLADDATYWVRQTINGCEGPLMQVTVNQVLSRNDMIFGSLKLYPNPVADKLIISNMSSIDNVKIYNIQGKLLYSQNFEATDAEIDFSKFAAGTYLLKISSGGATKDSKIVKL